MVVPAGVEAVMGTQPLAAALPARLRISMSRTSRPFLWSTTRRPPRAEEMLSFVVIEVPIVVERILEATREAVAACSIPDGSITINAGGEGDGETGKKYV